MELPATKKVFFKKLTLENFLTGNNYFESSKKNNEFTLEFFTSNPKKKKKKNRESRDRESLVAW